MKNICFKIVFILLVFFKSSEITAQIEEKSILFLELGRPTHTDMDFNEKPFLLGLNYRHNFSRWLNWSVFVKRISANSELDFFDNKARLLEYVNSSDDFGIGFRWSQIETYAFGASLNIVFINKMKHYFSLNLGAGYYTSNSSSQFFDEVTTENTFTPEGELISSEITDFVTAIDQASTSEIFIMPSLQYQYIFDNNIVLGFGVDFLLDQDNQAVTNQPVLANFYSFNVQLGKKF